MALPDDDTICDTDTEIETVGELLEVSEVVGVSVTDALPLSAGVTEKDTAVVSVADGRSVREAVVLHDVESESECDVDTSTDAERLRVREGESDGVADGDRRVCDMLSACDRDAEALGEAESVVLRDGCSWETETVREALRMRVTVALGLRLVCDGVCVRVALRLFESVNERVSCAV